MPKPKTQHDERRWERALACNKRRGKSGACGALCHLIEDAQEEEHCTFGWSYADIGAMPSRKTAMDAMHAHFRDKAAREDAERR